MTYKNKNPLKNMDSVLSKKKLLNPARTMTLTYIVSLTFIAGLSLFVHFTLDEIISEQSHSAKVINISGQQRMLSQRVTLFTTEYINQGNEYAKNEALAALNKMQNNHKMLLKEHFLAVESNTPSPLSDDMYALYFLAPHQIDKNIAELKTLITQILSKQSTDISFLPRLKNQMLHSFDTVVKQYEQESINKINELRHTQQLILVVIILTVLIEGLFILGPLLLKSDSYSKGLLKAAHFDYLTELHNRRSFSVIAKQAVATSQRYQSSLSVVSIDIDHFKSINDQFGHDAGDQVIRSVADSISNNIRSSDFAFRFGGEEFLILLPQTNILDAQKLAKKVHRNITNTPVNLETRDVDITISAGVAELNIGESDLEATLKRADEALYKAKNNGRNQVVLHNE
ncbi:diguanylate cyclase [Paraglaciecola sp.]|uniref:diguanylate cyclase n=1 Tax=Paraglaciecola sp. TaxID=1920173 RepID=UPI003263172F